MALFAKLRRWLDRPAIARAEAEQQMTPDERHEVDDGLVGYKDDIRAEGQLKPFIDHLEGEDR